MFLEIIKFAVYTSCAIISYTLSIYLETAIENGQEWFDAEGFFIHFPLLIYVLIGAFIEKFKQILAYSFIWGILFTLIGFIESIFIIPELPPEPDIFDLAFISPFPDFIPYLLAVFGVIFLIIFSFSTIGFILGSIKRKFLHNANSN
jgi:hypothetical protein